MFTTIQNQYTQFRNVLNSLIYILITGCRWCDLPQGQIWASKSATHRWLKRWQEDGTFEYLQARILAVSLRECEATQMRKD